MDLSHICGYLILLVEDSDANTHNKHLKKKWIFDTGIYLILVFHHVHFKELL